MFELRPNQSSSVEEIRQAYLLGYRAPLLVFPTGGGKTVMFSYVAKTASEKGRRVLILVHRIELMRQTSEKLHSFNVDHGLINPKFTPSYRKSVQVASVQTIVKRLHKCLPPDLIIVDEAHHATAGTWRKIINTYPEARILGVTATPCRGDGAGLGTQAGGLFDSLVMGPQVSQLISEGFLVSPRVYAPIEKLNLSGLRVKMGDYVTADLERVVDKPKITGHAVEHYKRLCDGVPAVAFCVSVAHAEHVAQDFAAAGYRAIALDGTHDDDYRKRALAGLANGRVQVIASCDLISEGTDIPAIGAAILLRPTQSTGLYLQQVGRALRPCEGKDYAIILDHVGNVLLHGLPDEDREWTLDGDKKRKRQKIEGEAGFKTEQCSNCFAIHRPLPVCPSCGHVKPAPKQIELAVQDGQLEQVTAREAAMIRRKKNQEVFGAKTEKELIEIAKERGYKAGWVRHILNSRQGKIITDQVKQGVAEEII